MNLVHCTLALIFNNFGHVHTQRGGDLAHSGGHDFLSLVDVQDCLAGHNGVIAQVALIPLLTSKGNIKLVF